MYNFNLCNTTSFLRIGIHDLDTTSALLFLHFATKYDLRITANLFLLACHRHSKYFRFVCTTW